jgi:hypothetical protein
MEESGNAAFAGREMDPEDALAASAYYDAVAKMLSKGGLEGTLREMRHLAFTDRNTGRDPLDRIKGPDGSDAPDTDAPGWRADDLRDDGYRGDEPAHGLDGPDDSPRGAAAPDGPAANIHLLVSAGTALGWSTQPGELSGFGPLDAQSARDPGWPSGQTSQTGPPGPAEQAAQVTELLDRLGISVFEPIARGTCHHRHREDRYTPSRKLADLIRARTATCPAPGCGASAVRNDLDHTRAWPGGPGTCECNLGPPCRHHHRVKQAPGWQLDQPEPGVMRWTTPSGRVYETRPTAYDL